MYAKKASVSSIMRHSHTSYQKRAKVAISDDMIVHIIKHFFLIFKN